MTTGEAVLATTTIDVTGAAAPQQPAATILAASPGSITVGASSTITATGLGDLAAATFGLGDTPGGSLSTGTGAAATTVQADATNGSAAVELSATEPRTFTVTVTDGETVLATTTVSVTAAAPRPSLQRPS